MADTVKLTYSETGQGLPVVLLHGFPLSGAIWHEVRQDLGERCRVIVPDLRGHGSSPAPPGVYEMDLLARDVLALLDVLHIQRAVIMGHSMGGYVTLAAWRVAPQRFLALGLIASQAGADSDEGRAGRNRLAEQVAAEGPKVVADAMLPKLFAPSRAAETALTEPVRQLILNTPDAGIIGSLRGMAVRPDSTALLSTIDIPVLIVAGDQDQIIPPSKAKAMAASMKTACHKSILNSGHMPMLEQPEATATALCEFMSKLGSAPDVALAFPRPAL